MQIGGGNQVPEGQQQELPQVGSQESELGQEEFFELLSTQLQHQDPLDPMDDREFIVQMTEFTQLDQLQNLNETQEKFSAMNFLGRHVVAETAEGEIIEGEVSAIKYFDGSPGLEIDGEQVSLDSVEEIKPVETDEN